MGKDRLGGTMTDLRNGHPTSLPRPPTYLPTYLTLLPISILYSSFPFCWAWGLLFCFCCCQFCLVRSLRYPLSCLRPHSRFLEYSLANLELFIEPGQRLTFTCTTTDERTNERKRNLSLILLTYKRFRCLLIHHGCSEILSLVERAVSCDLYLDRREPDTRVRQSVS